MTPVFMPHKKEPRALDWACAAMILGWSVILLLPGDTLSWSPSFAPLLSRASEPVWGLGLAALACTRILALIVNGRLPTGTPILRGAAAALSAVVWSQFMIGSLEASLRAEVFLPGIATNFVLLVCEIVTVTRSTKDFMRARQRRGDK